MNIIQQPDTLSMSANIKRFRISSQEQIPFTLFLNDEEVLSQNYDPGQDGIVEIDIRDIVHSRLSFTLNETDAIYEQSSLVKTFTAVISGQSISFKVIRSGVDRLADTPINFLTQNFLTWQPQVKPVTYQTPEFLTYYSITDAIVKLKGYFTDSQGKVQSDQIISLGEFTSGKAYTIPLQYAIINRKFDGLLPAFYDVWVEDPSGNRMTYIQRYYASGLHSEQEQWILFENSLGGIDTFRAYGSTDLNAEHTHNIAEIDETSYEYRIDTERKFQKNTGYLDKNQRQWLLDFFPSLGKYIYTGSFLRRIVLVESNVSYTDKELPSNYSFTYKYADARPLLNLPRVQNPPADLNISIPDLGSFTVPPRLVEFPRLILSEGALFPVQHPYSEDWGTTTVGALADQIGVWLGNNNVGGGVGHKHNNYDLLQVLSYVSEYLQVNGRKIKAGYADETYSFLDNIARELITHLKGLKIGQFIQGLRGGFFDEYANGEVESLTVRSFFKAAQYVLNNVVVDEGDRLFTSGVVVKSVIPQGDNVFLIQAEEMREGYVIPLAKDDLMIGTFIGSAGMFTSYCSVNSVDTVANTAVMTLADIFAIPASQNFAPVPLMTMARRGNYTDPDRQGVMYMSASDGSFYSLDGVDSFIISPLMKKAFIGKIKHDLESELGLPNSLPVHQGDTLVFGDVVIARRFIEVDRQNRPIPNYIDRGAWSTTSEFYPYINEIIAETGMNVDQVWNYSCLWRCVVPIATEEPKFGSSQWILISGDKTLSISLEFTNGKTFHANDVDTAVIATVFRGTEDITDRILDTDWQWTRDTGNIVADSSWNSSHTHITKELSLTVDDMGDDWLTGRLRKVKFTVTVFVRDGDNLKEQTRSFSYNK